LAVLDTNSIGYGFGARAPYAVDPWRSRGRLVAEPSSPTRSDFQRDRDRIVHSTAFRRLKHKTQVFIAHEGDHYRTRLTHTIEVAQIARGLTRALKLDEDLAEGVALVHDFGHTPFGHTGEDVLDALLADYGGFDHNAQSLRIVTRLERRYANFDGLNLTWETLEGLVKHNGPLLPADGSSPVSPVPQPILDYCAVHDLQLSSFASLEAQVAAIADDIAYNTHDIDDGLRSGLLTLDMLEDVPFLAGILALVRDLHPGLDDIRTAHELMRRQITLMVEDVISVAQGRLAALSPADCDAIRMATQPMAVFSPAMAEADRTIKAFLYRHLYRHADVMRIREQASKVVDDLFHAFLERPERMKGEFWQAGMEGLGPAQRARHVADYIAGMTDTYALSVHGSLFDHTPDLR
jgi:dGTPase